MCPSADTEGNDGGVLFTTFEEAGTLLWLIKKSYII
jgi:hypothetical protein